MLKPPERINNSELFECKKLDDSRKQFSPDII
jgi:hypothetical protein